MAPESVRLSVILYWHTDTEKQHVRAELLDLAPSELLPELIEQSKLPTSNADDGQPITYELCHGSEYRPGQPLRSNIALGDQGVNQGGSKLWIVSIQPPRQTGRCILQLPRGFETVIAKQRAQSITRDSLLAVIQQHDAELFERERQRCIQGTSVYVSVSREPHCTVSFRVDGYWIETDRSKYIWIDGELIEPNTPTWIHDASWIQFSGPRGLKAHFFLV